jgi:RimJ/RimL family protein N-acetyltransferase
VTDLSAWTARAAPTRDVLEGRFVRLEPLDPARHGDDLFAASAAPGASERFRWLFEEPPESRETFQPWLDKVAASDDPLFFAVVPKATGRAEGRLTFMRIDRPHGVIETGSILFGPALARTPAATEAICLQARHAFETLGYRRFEWKCNDGNEPSKRAALRFGFTFEGVFRQHMVAKGRNRDTAWFAMLDREWPQRKGAFERWLAPENFDGKGAQILSLAALNALTVTADGVELSRADADDLGRFDEIQQAAYAPNRSLLGGEPLPLTLTPGAVLGAYEIWLAGDDGALVLDPRPDHLVVWSVAVAPSAQGTGLGNRLLDAAESRARRLGLPTLRLYTGERLTRNVAWYERRGYAIERIEALPDRRLVHMVKHIQNEEQGRSHHDGSVGR